MKSRFNSYTKNSILRIGKFIQILLIIAVYVGCLYFYNTEYNQNGVGKTRFMIFVALYTAVLCFSLRTYRAYDLGFHDVSMLIYSQTLAILVAGVAFYIVFVVANSTLFTPVPLLVMLILQVLLSCVWSVIGNKLFFRLNKPKKAVVFYSDNLSLLRLQDVIKNDKTFTVTNYIEVKKEYELSDVKQFFENCGLVITTGVPLHLRNDILECCLSESIPCYTVPTIGDIVMQGAKHLDSFSVPVFQVSRAEPNVEYAFIKRALDIVISLVGIIVLSPVMIITALAIRLYDKGPAFYKQVRLTKNGNKFKILKFRSMHVNAESDGVARLATDNDDRITPVGKIIRACRLDELPQLFNILKGDMTIVGPRPERPEIAAQYEEDLPEFALRLQVKAGLTGLAQIYGRYNTEPYDKLQMDLMYVNNMSFSQDLKLIFATIKILFIKESTQGTAEGQITAAAHTDKESISR